MTADRHAMGGTCAPIRVDHCVVRAYGPPIAMEPGRTSPWGWNVTKKAAVGDKIQLALLVKFLKQKGRSDIKIDDIIGLAETMAKTLDESVLTFGAELHQEFSAIASEISSLRRDIYELRPDQIRFARIPEAGRELDAVVESTEEATHIIMSAAESIMAAEIGDAETFKAMVDDKMITIFEACAFQDLTGQRVRKVVKTLSWIEERIARLAEKLASVSDIGVVPVEPETEDERRMRELLLHGPQMKGQGVSQTAVDSLMAKSDQDDIDRLFD
ncbi:MAG: protein phosphatase CheZ [Ancalomicrobiaceae bacterium]|nr:protein phosphatase CheZ [Ancalomicrobiaceae bacterium]